MSSGSLYSTVSVACAEFFAAAGAADVLAGVAGAGVFGEALCATTVDGTNSVIATPSPSPRLICFQCLVIIASYYIQPSLCGSLQHDRYNFGVAMPRQVCT